MLNVFGSPETSRCYDKANSFFHWIEKVFNFPSCLACQIVFVRFWVLCFVLDLKGLQVKIKLVPLNLGNMPAWYKDKVYPENKVTHSHLTLLLKMVSS